LLADESPQLVASPFPLLGSDLLHRLEIINHRVTALEVETSAKMKHGGLRARAKKKKEKSQHSIDLGRTNEAPFAFFFSMSAVIARFQNNGIHTHQNESYLS
jgi:hypothetical protein